MCKVYIETEINHEFEEKKKFMTTMRESKNEINWSVLDWSFTKAIDV